MPPYIEVDSHHNDEYTLLQKSNADDIKNNNNFPSPLFHDDVLSTPPITSRLDRRQSDPGFTGQSSVKEDPMKKPLLDSRVGEVSRIQEIIGPESAYVRIPSVNNNNSTANKLSSTATTNTATNTTPKPRIVYKNGIPQKPKSQQSEEKKKDLPSLEVQIYRTTKKGCKKVYKTLKSISKKCKLSTFKSSKKNKNAV